MKGTRGGDRGRRDKQRMADTMKYSGGDLNRIQVSSGDGTEASDTLRCLPGLGARDEQASMGAYGYREQPNSLGQVSREAPFSSSQQVRKASARYLLQGQWRLRLSSLLGADCCLGSGLTSFPTSRSALGKRPLLLMQTNELN